MARRGLSNRERDRAKTALTQAACGRCEERNAKSCRPVFRQYAHLRDVANIGAHLRAQDQADQRARAALEDDERSVRVEHAASRKAHDVVQEAQRTAERAVLVVDLGIDVPAIRRR